MGKIAMSNEQVAISNGKGEAYFLTLLIAPCSFSFSLSASAYRRNKATRIFDRQDIFAYTVTYGNCCYY